MRRKTKTICAGVAVLALAVPTAASAHVTLQPEQVPAGSFPRLDVRVPNEMDDAATDKVSVEMPDGFIFASYESIPGWKVDVQEEKLDEPIEAFGDSYKTQVKTITWTAEDDASAIQPGQFRDFGLEVGIPSDDVAGDVLTFPAVQTYDNGDVARWIGDPDSEEPAPTVTLTEAAEDHHSDAAEESHESEAADEDEASEEDGGAPTWLAILGVVLGAIGIGVGGAALRRRS